MTKAEFIVQCIAAVLGNTQGPERIAMMEQANVVCEKQAEKQVFDAPKGDNVSKAIDNATGLGMLYGIGSFMMRAMKE